MNELPSPDPALLAELDAEASTPEDAARLRKHAEHDPAAAAILAALADTRAQLADTPVPDPPPDLVARWHNALAQLPPPVPVLVLAPHPAPASLPASAPPPAALAVPSPAAATPRPVTPATSPPVVLATPSPATPSPATPTAPRPAVLARTRTHPRPLRRGTQRKAPRRSRRMAAAATVAATAAAVTVLVGPPAPTAVRTTEAPLTLVSEQLSEAAAAGLSGHDLGPLADPAVLAGCLTRIDTGPLTGTRDPAGTRPPGATSAAATPLGGRPVLLDGRPGILLALPGERPGRLRLLVVTPDCAPNRGTVLADTTAGG